ncbi:hypothetical protein [Rhodopseudomonas palustris]|nr:hypothetical protein [Rhodopseudomonas palustris]
MDDSSAGMMLRIALMRICNENMDHELWLTSTHAVARNRVD